MEKLRNLIIENVAMFREAFPTRSCPSPDLISAISYDHPFTYGQVENEIEKMVHEGVLEAELSDSYSVKLG